MFSALIFLLFVWNRAFAQFENTIAITVPDEIVDATKPAIFSYAWVGDPGHDLRNISMELIAEERQDIVVDIIAVEYTQENGNSIAYPLHAATPAGAYHIRMNATIYDGDSPLSSIQSRSRTFNITLSNSFQCDTPTFTPVRSVSDPAYSPVRIATPVGGTVFLQDMLNVQQANITGMLSVVDASFDLGSMNATLELVNVGTIVSTPARPVPQADVRNGAVSYRTDNITLTDGTWKLRINFTNSANTSAPHTASSDPFDIVFALPCAGLSSGSSNSTSISLSTSSTTAISSPSFSASASNARQSLPSTSFAGVGLALLITLSLAPR